MVQQDLPEPTGGRTYQSPLRRLGVVQQYLPEPTGRTWGGPAVPTRAHWEDLGWSSRTYQSLQGALPTRAHWEDLGWTYQSPLGGPGVVQQEPDVHLFLPPAGEALDGRQLRLLLRHGRVELRQRLLVIDELAVSERRNESINA